MWNYNFNEAPKDGTLLLFYWSKEGNPRKCGYELRAMGSYEDGEWDTEDRIAHKLLNTIHGPTNTPFDDPRWKFYYPTAWMVFPEIEQ